MIVVSFSCIYITLAHRSMSESRLSYADALRARVHDTRDNILDRPRSARSRRCRSEEGSHVELTRVSECVRNR